ncbi:hypothetical protein [Streptomyces griseofuscus]|uniref:Uncharacterized protein n=1 Tax=Streptomyces griseofuscus TaxID=146922 RepID=A0A7H1Q3P4_9ACTN|nr:hypothetical protein [Streptomyces griseofuscus]QNT94924.1 hypothetical protein HEP81_04652 [Streptomyces griseofuscus]
MSDRITLDPTLDPWERQPGETPKRHSRFLVFRDLGLTRTLAKASDQLALSYSHVRALAAQYRWQDRAAAWDAHQQQQYTAEMEEERRKSARDDAKILRIMTGMVGQALPHIQQQVGSMTVMEFTRFVETTMRLRRNLFGDPTETIAVTGPGGDPLTVQVEEFQKLPPEQRRVRLAELAATVARRAHALDDTDDEDDGTYDPGDDQDDDEPGEAAGERGAEPVDEDSGES